MTTTKIVNPHARALMNKIYNHKIVKSKKIYNRKKLKNACNS